MNSTSDKFSQFMQQRGRLIAQILAALLALVTLFIIAKLVWLWVEHLQPKQPVQAAVIEQPRQPRVNVNVNKLVAMHIFGEANAAPEPEQVQAEETRLNLKLMGTFVSRNLELSSAIILSNGNKEKAYFVGDKLEVGGNVTLHQVETQKVIIKNGGRYETLTLIENVNESMVSSAPKVQETSDAATRTIDKRRDSRLTQDLGELREKLYSSPQSLAGLAQFERVIDESGMVSGYKVAPGKDPRMFARLGLRRNDVIKSVNGSPLNEQGYLGIIEELNNADSLEVTIERNGQPVTLLLGLSGQNPQNAEQNTGQQRTDNQRLTNEIK